MLRYATWALNNRCNMSCPYCFADNYFKENDLQDKYKIVDRLNDLGINTIDFFGKEVLINKDIFLICDYIKEKGYSFCLSMITNGLNLKKCTEDIILSGISSVSVSYDFKASRTFNIDLKDLFPLYEKGINTEITIDVQKGNIDKVVDFIRDPNNRFIDCYYLNPIMPFGRRENEAREVSISKEEYYNILKEVENEDKVLAKIPFEWESKMWNDLVLPLDRDLKCSAGLDHLFIASDGEVYGCNTVAYKHGKQHCNILTSSLKDIQDTIRTRGDRVCALC